MRSINEPCVQGRNEVKWRPGQAASLEPPYANLRSFGSKCTVLMKVLVTLLGLFSPPAVIRCPRSDSAHEQLCSPFPLVTPLHGLPRLSNCGSGAPRFRGRSVYFIMMFRVHEGARMKVRKNRVSVCDVCFVRFHLNTSFLHVLRVLCSQYDTLRC